jgi:hypothetical protein
MLMWCSGVAGRAKWPPSAERLAALEGAFATHGAASRSSDKAAAALARDGDWVRAPRRLRTCTRSGRV